MPKTIDFETIVDNLPNAYLILKRIKDEEKKNFDFSIAYINKTGLNDLGLKKDQIKGKKITEIFTRDADLLIKKCKFVLTSNAPDRLKLSLNESTFITDIFKINDRVTLNWHSVNADPFNKKSLNKEIGSKDLHETEKQYHALFNAIDEGFCIIEILFDQNNKPVDYRFLDVNEAFEKQTGLINVIGKRMREITPEAEEYWIENYGNVAITGKPIRFQNYAEVFQKWYDVYAFTLGKIEDRKVAVLFKDITEQKNTEEALLSKAVELESILNSIADGVFVYDKKGRIVLSNAAAIDIMSYQQEELKTTLAERFKLFKVTTEDGRVLKPEEMPAYRAIEFTETTKSTVLRIRGKGEAHWVTLSAAPLFIDGQHTGAVISMSDITARKKAEEELRINEAALSAFFDSSTGILNLFDQKLRYVKCDPITPTYFGLDQQSIIGKSVSDLNPVFAEEFLHPLMQRVIKSGKPEMDMVVPGPIPSRQGEISYWLMSYFPVPLSRDEMGLGAMGVDITDLKHAEDALKESETKLLDAQKLGKFGSYTVDMKNNNEMQWSDQMFELWEFDKSQPIPEFDTLWSLIHPEDRDVVENTFKGATKENNKMETEFRIVFPDNRVKYIHLITRGYFDEKGNLIRREGVEVDITERKVNQLKLEEANKNIADRLKEKEVLLREIFHRTKNSLQLISSLLTLKAGDLPDPQMKEIVNDVQDRIKAIALVHEKLYKSNNLSRVNLKEYITGLSDLLLDTHHVGDKILLKLKLEDIFILIDTAIPCGLIITELIINSIKHAFPDDNKGFIEIKLRRIKDQIIELVIADNGIGFKNSEQDRLGKLGLQLFKGIAEDQLEAEVSLNSENGVAWTLHFKDLLYNERV